MNNMRTLVVLALFAINELSIRVAAISNHGAPKTNGNNLQARDPPTVTPVTVAPQTAEASGAFSTLYVSYSGVTENSAVTQVIGGTSTVLPLWYCDPALSAEACKGCPATTTTGQQPCPTDFNMLMVVPPVVMVGVWMPPPHGLPTLTVGSDGVPTPKITPTATPKLPSSLSIETTTTEEPFIVDPPCTIPPVKAADKASSVEPNAPVWTPPAGSPGPTLTEALPVLPITNNPAAPTAWLGCGAGQNNPYVNGGFYQFGNDISRDDALFTIGKFCEDEIAAKVVIGPSDSRDKSFPKIKPVEFVSKSIKTPGGSGKIMIGIWSDVKRLNTQNQDCPAKDNPWLYTLADSIAYAPCRQYFAQAIEYCDNEKKAASSDITWKHGGTFFTKCTYFSVWKDPDQR